MSIKKNLGNRIREIRISRSLTQEALAARLGKSRSHITNMLVILNLPEEVKDMIMVHGVVHHLML